MIPNTSRSMTRRQHFFFLALFCNKINIGCVSKAYKIHTSHSARLSSKFKLF